MEKRWTILKADEAAVKSLQEILKIHPVICKILVQRGISGYDESKKYFRPQLSDLHNPWLMKDMEKAVDRITAAIDSGEKILVFGDYDVDGTTAVSLVYAFLEENGFEISSAEFERIPNDTKSVTPEQREQIEKLIDKLEDDEDVQNVFHNMKEEDEE